MPRHTFKLSNEEFDSCLLKKKLSFQLSESARLVLVHGISAETAAGIAGMRAKGDVTKVNDTVSMIVESHQDMRKRA